MIHRDQANLAMMEMEKNNDDMALTAVVMPKGTVEDYQLMVVECDT